nr:ribonuclease H-like domain-containing protein [Tanacetum cinerariifolium]GEX47799.1 ribonuclease H-like domain-containing protein [Tanacetum cinerariifolium]
MVSPTSKPTSFLFLISMNSTMIHEVNSSPSTVIVLECSTSSKGHHLPMNEPLKNNTDSPVDEKNPVTYAINGLADKYEGVAGIIHHRDTPPTFVQAQSMLLMEESSLNHTGVLGPAPGQAYVVQPTAIGSSGPSSYTTGPPPGTWGPQVVYGPYVDQATTLPLAFNAMMVQDYGDSGWYMDTGATTHLASDTGPIDSPPAHPITVVFDAFISQTTKLSYQDTSLSMIMFFPYGTINLPQPNTYQFLDTTYEPSPMSLKLLTTPNNTPEPVNPPNLSPIPALNTLEHNTQTQVTINSQEVQPNQQPTSAQLPSESTTTTPSSAQTQQSTQQHIMAQHINIEIQPTQTYPMVTRSKVGIVKSNLKFSFHVSMPSPIPRLHTYALRETNWQHALLYEYNALISNGTWVLVPRSQNVNVVHSMWLFKHKFHADGSLSRYKARLFSNGRSQQQGIDYDETFSPVVKPATICIVLNLSISRHWPIHQLDVKNAFLYGHLTETVYMHNHQGLLIQHTPTMSASCRNPYMALNRPHITYALEVLEWAGMLNCNASNTLVATESKLDPDGDPVCLFMHDPREPYFFVLKRILRYVRGPVAPPLGALPRVTMFSLATTLFHGPLNANTLSLA